MQLWLVCNLLCRYCGLPDICLPLLLSGVIKGMHLHTGLLMTFLFWEDRTFITNISPLFSVIVEPDGMAVILTC